MSHTLYFSRRVRESLVVTEEGLAGTFRQSSLCWGCPSFGGLLGNTDWGL